MSLRYCTIEVYTSETVKHRGHALGTALVQRIHDLRIAARCMAFRGIAGCYENGDIATHAIEVLSFNMPLKIEIVLPAAELDRVLPVVEEMVGDGIVTVREATVLVHRVSARLLPTSLRVRDIMTPDPKRVVPEATAAEVLRLLLASTFNSVPVVDAQNRPVGIVTQGDLIARAGMPIRLGLLRELGSADAGAALQRLAARTASEIMTHPVVTVPADTPVPQAVDCMLEHHLKRLPVVNESGVLVGMVARLDVFRTVTRHQPDWTTIHRAGIEIARPQLAADIMSRQVHTVLASAPVEEVMALVDDSDVQRVAVVDEQGRLRGIISDRDLLQLFSEHRVGLWDHLASRLTFTAMGQRHKAVLEQAGKRTAGEVMQSDVVSVPEDAPVDQVIRLMASRRLKRLPVVGPEGQFRGMVSRDAVLRAGMGQG